MVMPINTASVDIQAANAETSIFNQIKGSGTSREQLKKAATEFEAVFITKMLTMLEKTVEKDDGAFGQEGDFLKNFKSLMFNEMGRSMAKSPTSTFGFASQIYKQMEKFAEG